MRQWVWAIILFLSSIAPLKAGEPFYQVSTPVASQAPEARTQAASKALKDMLWRLTGGKYAEQNAAMSSVFNQAETYADSFSYTSSGQVTFAFSPQALNQLVKDYALPYWPANRPKILVWVLNNDQWLAGDKTAAEAPALSELKSQALVRGITLSFPRYDAEDRTALSIDQFKAFDNEALLNASFRYSLDTIMAVHLSETGSRWQFDHRGEKRTGTDSVQGINQLADFLAARYAVGGNATAAVATTTFIAISADSFARVKQISDYLKKHSLITNSRLVQSSGKELVFEVSLRASLSQFNSSLSLDQRMEAGASPEGAIAASATLSSPLNYRWIAN